MNDDSTTTANNNADSRDSSHQQLDHSSASPGDADGQFEAAEAFDRMKSIIDAMGPSLAPDDQQFAGTWLDDLLGSMDGLAQQVHDLDSQNSRLHSEVKALTVANQKLLAEKRRVQLSNLNLQREVSSSRDVSHNNSRDSSPTTQPHLSHTYGGGNAVAGARPVLHQGLSTPPPNTHSRNAPHHTATGGGSGVYGAPPPPSPFGQQSVGGADSMRSLEMSGVYTGGGHQASSYTAQDHQSQLQYVSSRHLPPASDDARSIGGHGGGAGRQGHAHAPRSSSPEDGQYPYHPPRSSASPSVARAHDILGTPSPKGGGGAAVRDGGGNDKANNGGLSDDVKLAVIGSIAAVTGALAAILVVRITK